MFIIGTRKSENEFEDIVAIFEQSESALEWLKNNHLQTAVHQLNMKFPLYVIDHFTDQPRYQLATSAAIKTWAETFQQQESDSFQYFLFFRVSENIYNKAFPGKFCLNGSADHYHIRNIELNLILTSGVEALFLPDEAD